MTHDFHQSLAYSHSQSDAPWWGDVYRAAFPAMAVMVDHRQNGDHQKAGIDRSIVMHNGKVIYVDEKVRRKDYGDILLEYVSNDVYATPGWVCKPLLADYIAYAIEPTQVCYLLPVLQMQLAWGRAGEAWIKEFGTKKAQNAHYVTLSCPVPVRVLYREILGAMRIEWGQASQPSPDIAPPSPPPSPRPAPGAQLELLTQARP